MKKLLALLLALSCAATMTACGTKETDKDDDKEKEKVEEKVDEKVDEKNEGEDVAVDDEDIAVDDETATDSLGDAVLADYPSVPFTQLLEKGFKAQLSALEYDINLAVSYEEGWDNATEPVEGSGSATAKPVTYIITMTNVDLNEEIGYNLFMELDNGQLAIAGGVVFAGDTVEVGSKDDVKMLIDSIISAYEA